MLLLDCSTAEPSIKKLINQTGMVIIKPINEQEKISINNKRLKKKIINLINFQVFYIEIHNIN